jgi:putative ABC transport system permease protein
LLAQSLTESLLLSSAGTAVGLAIAALGTKFLGALAPVDTPGIETAGLHASVLCYAVGIAFLTTVVFGLLPALGSSHSDVSIDLKEIGRSNTPSARSGRLRRFLISAELSTAMVLAVSAGLMVKTLLHLHRVDLGFRPDHVVTLRIPLSDVRYNEKAKAEFYRTLLTRLNAAPGIKAVTISRGIPFFGWAGQGFAISENPNPAPNDRPDANYLTVAPQYFDVLRIPLADGRAFAERDSDASLPVAIVNQALAQELWPGQNALGKKLRILWNDQPWLTVVGIAGNVRTQGVDRGFAPEIYTSYLQHPWFLTPRHLIIRTAAANALSILPTVRTIVRELDPDQPVADVRTLEAAVSEPLTLRNLLTYLLGGFALLALLLAAVGVYGVIAYSVALRLPEMGIRVALGANKGQVLHLVLNDALRLGAMGIALGLAGSLVAAHFLSSQLFEVTASDPSILLVTSVVLGAVTALAGYLPARRAADVDPLAVLRHD